MNNDKLMSEHTLMRDALEQIRTLWNQNTWDSVSAKIASEALHRLDQKPRSRLVRLARIASGTAMIIAPFYGISYLSTLHPEDWWSAPSCLMLLLVTVAGGFLAILGLME